MIGSGKDFQSFLLIKERGFVRVDFKDALIEMASDLVGCDIRPEYDWFKAAIVGVRMPANPLTAQNLMAEMKALIAKSPGILTGRILLQRLGTEVMRKRDKDYWVKEWRKRVDAAQAGGAAGVACADCRFPNEVHAVLSAGGEVRFCDYHSHRYEPDSAHASEKMAQALLRLGVRDGEVLRPEMILKMESVLVEGL